MTPPPAAGKRNMPQMAAAIVAAVVLVGGGIALALWLTRDDSANKDNSRMEVSPSPAGVGDQYEVRIWVRNSDDEPLTVESIDLVETREEDRRVASATLTPTSPGWNASQVPSGKTILVWNLTYRVAPAQVGHWRDEVTVHTSRGEQKFTHEYVFTEKTRMEVLPNPASVGQNITVLISVYNPRDEALDVTSIDLRETRFEDNKVSSATLTPASNGWNASRIAAETAAVVWEVTFRVASNQVGHWQDVVTVHTSRGTESFTYAFQITP